ncbi:MAG: tRNA (adenosine(37)-N6)-dimethylallyltransferase MiaA [Candidatus Omnitrophota bacterium]|nr:MAG: tRNA (adenosine(37)-N6)-dimethylallyltransferase MiaA [Candidatus Omnitrophota bacterium]
MHPIIFITGPTATGKTELSFVLAKHLNAQIISCDSMLIYKEPRIITSKPSAYILKEIPHYFVNIISVKDSYNVFDYYREALQIVKNLFQKNTLHIVCGGSGLYIKAILDGIFEGASKDENLRKDLLKKAEKKGRNSLFEELKRVDPQTATRVSPRDLRRIIRALEVYYLTGVPISIKKTEREGLYGKYPIRIFGLRLSRTTLYEKINERVEEMFKEGAVDEVQKLLKLDLSITARKIIGIKEIEDFPGRRDGDGEYGHDRV